MERTKFLKSVIVFVIEYEIRKISFKMSKIDYIQFVNSEYI